MESITFNLKSFDFASAAKGKPQKSSNSNLGMLDVLPWNILHALLITTSVLYLNKGVMKDPPKFAKRNPEIANLKFLSEESNC